MIQECPHIIVKHLMCDEQALVLDMCPYLFEEHGVVVDTKLILSPQSGHHVDGDNTGLLTVLWVELSWIRKVKPGLIERD